MCGTVGRESTTNKREFTQSHEAEKLLTVFVSLGMSSLMLISTTRLLLIALSAYKIVATSAADILCEVYLCPSSQLSLLEWNVFFSRHVFDQVYSLNVSQLELALPSKAPSKLTNDSMPTSLSSITRPR
jgi:hypothetical protein